MPDANSRKLAFLPENEGQPPQDGGPEVAANYIFEIVVELRAIANSAGFTMLAHILDMAAEEAGSLKEADHPK